MTETVEIQRKLLLTAALGAIASVTFVKNQQIELPPGRMLGLRRHPCPVVGYVAAGAINFQIAGGPIQLLHSGDGFYEPSVKRVVHFDVASRSASATFIAFYLLAAVQHELIEMINEPGGGN